MFYLHSYKFKNVSCLMVNLEYQLITIFSLLPLSIDETVSLECFTAQATQQSSWQCDSSQGRSSPLKCSQEQIEKKRQAALQRKLQSKAKTKWTRCYACVQTVFDLTAIAVDCVGPWSVIQFYTCDWVTCVLNWREGILNVCFVLSGPFFKFFWHWSPRAK